MTPEQTIELAKQAGFSIEDPDYHCREKYWIATQDEIQRFAELVGNAKLEEAAKVVEKMANDKKTTQQQQFALDLASDAIRGLKS